MPSMEWLLKVGAEPASIRKASGCVYIMTRADGWHKIGYTSSEPEKRLSTVQTYTSPALRPVRLCRVFEVGTDAIIIEKLSHLDLMNGGYERGDQLRNWEWFNVSYRRAVKAVWWGIHEYDRRGPKDCRRVLMAACIMRPEHLRRPKSVWPDAETEAKARAIWANPHYATREAAIAHMPEGVTPTLIKRLGPRLPLLKKRKR